VHSKVGGSNPRLVTHFVCVALTLRDNLDDVTKIATSPDDFDACDPRGAPREHGAIGISVRRHRIHARSPSVGLRGRKTLRGGSDVTSVNLSVQYARISIQDGYIYRYDGQCTIICTAFSRGMLHWSRNGLCIRRSVVESEVGNALCLRRT
jgi:hypothetical protein